MDAATAGLIGTAIGGAIGFLGNTVVTWINRYFDEKKARRELLLKTAWDYYSARREIWKITGGAMMPFEVFLLQTVKVIDVALGQKLSHEQILEQMRKIHGLEEGLKQIIRDYSKTSPTTSQS